MKKWCNGIGMLLLALICAAGVGSNVQAKEKTIESGVTIGTIDVSGMTVKQATSAVDEYVKKLGDVKINLTAAEGNVVTVTANDLGISWGDQNTAEQAAELGKQGNVVQRYKALKELKASGKNYPLTLSFDDTAIGTVLKEKCAQYDKKAENASLTREDGAFKVVDGETGYVLNEDQSKSIIKDYLTKQWDGSEADITLQVDEQKPQGDAETLSKVKDVLGTYTTTYKTSGKERCQNIANGCKLINGTTLYPGEQLSVLAKITPFTEKNGYSLAGSYLNGQVVESFGGGICQVSTTLYNAVLRSELQVDERSNHSMIINYVDPSEDAAIAENGGKDFKFTNNLKYPVYIEGITGGKSITFTVYGVETRDSARTVEFESKVLETTVPPTDTIIQDGAQPIGYIQVQAVHIGYKAQLWKVVKENGKEVSREQVNSSTYKAVPRTATVGTMTDNPDAANQLQAAIATGNVDTVKAVIGSLTGAAAPAATTPAATTPDAAAAAGSTAATPTDGTVGTTGTVTDGATGAAATAGDAGTTNG